MLYNVQFVSNNTAGLYLSKSKSSLNPFKFNVLILVIIHHICIIYVRYCRCRGIGEVNVTISAFLSKIVYKIMYSLDIFFREHIIIIWMLNIKKNCENIYLIVNNNLIHFNHYIFFTFFHFLNEDFKF